VTPVAVRVALEPAADPGDDPFLAEVEVREVAAFPDSVLAVADTGIADMATDPASGTLTIMGTAAALYRGRPDATGLYAAAANGRSATSSSSQPFSKQTRTTQPPGPEFRALQPARSGNS